MVAAIAVATLTMNARLTAGCVTAEAARRVALGLLDAKCIREIEWRLWVVARRQT